MAHEPVENDVAFIESGSPSLMIPIIPEPTAEELARRRRVAARARAVRKRIGSIGIASDDLIHESRQEDEKRVNGWFADK
jgi:hypothetical protein